MSAILLWTTRHSGEPICRPSFLSAFGKMDYRGRDGSRVLWRQGAAIGHQHFWTLPEEVGENQPHSDWEMGFDLAFDGRLDNREELSRLLGILPAEASKLSDSEILCAAYREWQDRCFEKLLGPAALVILDWRRRRVLCYRDPLGSRPLYFSLTPGAFFVASEERALLACPGVSSQLDEVATAHFLALESPPEGTTFFSDVREVPAATRLVFENDSLKLHRHWSMPETPELNYRRDADYAAHFRQLLQESVACRSRTVGPSAVLMSGGLDSTTVAALATRNSQSAPRPRPISWIFDELPEADEREFIQDMNRTHGLSPILVRGDERWPLRDFESWPVSSNSPLNGAFRLLLNGAYEAAHEAGCRTLLTGEFGDKLYYGHTHWLRDLVRQRRWATALQGIGHELIEWRGRGRARLRSAAGRLLGRPAWEPGIPPWLTPLAARIILDERSKKPGLSSRRPEQLRMLLNNADVQAVAMETEHSLRHGLEVRRPYRDRRLVEFMASIPAHQFYRLGWSKWILRQATSDLLPPSVRWRRRPSSLISLAQRGLVERELAHVSALLHNHQSQWKRYVDSAWMKEAFPQNLRNRIDGASSVVPWRCICLELWRTRCLEHGREPSFREVVSPGWDQPVLYKAS